VKKLAERKAATVKISFAHMRAAHRCLFDKEDVLLTNIAAYHLQQALENWMKAMLLQRDLQPPHIHDVKILVYMLKSLGAQIPEWLYLNSEAITGYAVKVRYRGDLTIEYDKILGLLNAAQLWLNQEKNNIL
jgi:HEPN domain-containing protein